MADTRSASRHLAAFVVGLAVMLPSVAWATFSDADSRDLNTQAATMPQPQTTTALLGTCSLTTGDQIIVSWTLDDPGPATDTEIHRATTSGGPYTLVHTTTPSTLTWTDDTVAYSTTYYYVVRTVRDDWTSVNSNEASRTTRSSLCV